MRLALLVAPALLASGLAGHAAPASAAAATCDGRAATIVVTPGDDTTYGTGGDDVIVGTEAGETIFGLGGHDTICGLGGADQLRGQEGDDRLFGGLDETYVVDDGYRGDLLVPGPGDDHVDPGADPQSLDIHRVDGIADVDRVSYELSDGPVVVDLAAGTATGEGSDTLVLGAVPVGVAGSPHDDTIAGADQPTAVEGGPGDDTITTGDGDDVVLAAAGGERRQEGFHDDDRVSTGRGDDFVTLGHSRDVVRTGPGDDVVSIAKGADRSRVRTGGGEDDVSMSSAVDVRTGGARDTLWVRLRPEMTGFRIDGGADKDRIDLLPTRLGRGAAITWDNARGRVHVDGRLRGRTSGLERLDLAKGARWTFLGASYAEVVAAWPSASPVLLRGGGGFDTLSGTSGNDVLDGGPGGDRLRGRGGRDRCLSGVNLRSCELRR